MGVYFILPRFMRNSWLLLVSLFFYFWGEQFLVAILLASTAIDYACGLLIGNGFQKGPLQPLEPGGRRTFQQKAALATSICSNLALLGFFKYYGWGVDSMNAVLHSAGLGTWGIEKWIEVTLPLGISFFTFQSMSYTLDVYFGKVRATRSLLNFA